MRGVRNPTDKPANNPTASPATEPAAEPAAPTLRIEPPKQSAVGLPGIAHSLQYTPEEPGPERGLRALARLNQTDGFDCPSCAWPDPDPEHRKTAEFCETGVKAVAWEATRKRVDRSFFASHTLDFLRTLDDHRLEWHGRLTEPMYLAPGAANYTPIGWDEAQRLLADRLLSLDDPDRAVFYTSGRASNEAAVRLPTPGPSLRHQQPAGLLEHVP
jgi:anaerobic selenocysteine-containing dehydrogenase